MEYIDIDQKYDEVMQKKKARKNYDLELSELLLGVDNVTTKALSDMDYKGNDTDIIIQDARRAVLAAMDTYNKDGGAKFSTYVYTRIEYAISTTLRKINSSANKALNNHKPIDYYEDRIPSGDDIEEKYNNTKRIEQAMAGMTQEEREVVTLFVEGNTYEEIAKKIHKTKKDVDNIFLRIRKRNKS